MRTWLKEKRTGKGLTMAKMAEELSLTESYYSRIESGDRQKKMDILLVGRIASVLDMPVADIIELEGKEAEA